MRMNYSVYGHKDDHDHMLLVDDSFWVINGAWQIEVKDDKFYCVSPKSTFQIDIELLGHIEYDGDYNSTLKRFKNGEGTRILRGITEPVVDAIPELCKRKYYGIECSCSKCKGK